MKKLMCMLILALVVTSMVMPVSAVEKVDYAEKNEVKAERDLSNNIISRGLFDDYNVYSGGEWIVNNQNIGVGAKGWTNIVNKSDGSYRYHYTKVVVYADSAENIAYPTSKVWGEGVIEATTGDLGNGAMHHYRIFYGW
ncbi:hypothetical protein [Sedimentibacter saalensis]|uniref:Uncharacterized protein n=1 Tax=Sedimentibacter saalensis TaxID=130788 RepID=A0A562JK36_9FIRM|nr:hypothetical protein [Sedimentibacter saalensis]TWH83448.1 hypothetical protein LY60_00055 [Sedimentibacter saalensis]